MIEPKIEDISELNFKIANVIFNKIVELLKYKKFVVLGIPGGNSVIGLFQELKKLNLPWKKIHFFMVDERLVSITNPLSNFKQADDLIFKQLIEEKNTFPSKIHPFIVDFNKKDYGILEYQKELRKFGGKYDLIILGVGDDGHIAGLFPNHHSVKDESEYYLTYLDSPKLPLERMSISKKLLIQTNVAILLFFGESKRKALLNFNNKLLNEISCPAKLALNIKQFYIFTDLS